MVVGAPAAADLALVRPPLVSGEHALERERTAREIDLELSLDAARCVDRIARAVVRAILARIERRPADVPARNGRRMRRTLHGLDRRSLERLLLAAGLGVARPLPHEARVV